MVLLLGLSLYGMGHVKKAFFTASNTPMFYMDIWLPYGTDIRTTLATVEEVEAFIRQNEAVEFVSSTVGRGAPRFFMTYLPEQSFENFGQLQVRANNLQAMREFMPQLDAQMYVRFPQVLHQMREMVFGPPTRSEIEARFRGPDPDVLRDLGNQAAAIIRSDYAARSVYVNWQERGKELVPMVNESEARRLGISNEEIASSLKIAFGGLPVGVYRDGTRKLPILVRLPEQERVARSLEAMREYMPQLDAQMYLRFPQVLHQMREMVFGPPTRSEIEARFRGPDPDVLRDLGNQAAAIIRSDAAARSVYINWQERGKELVPMVNESEARRLGISNEEIAISLKMAFGGLPVGGYRDGIRKLPILVRLPERERVDFDRIETCACGARRCKPMCLFSRLSVVWTCAGATR